MDIENKSETNQMFILFSRVIIFKPVNNQFEKDVTKAKCKQSEAIPCFNDQIWKRCLLPAPAAAAAGNPFIVEGGDHAELVTASKSTTIKFKSENGYPAKRSC